MNDIHPTETGGDGKVIIRRQQHPADPIKDIIKCYQCGYSFQVDRDLEGDSETDGNELVTTTVAIANDQSKLPLPLRGMTTFSASSRDVIEPNVTSGCPFCGTYNPRGHGSEDDFFSTVDLSDK
jgi:hypothetical protein